MASSISDLFLRIATQAKKRLESEMSCQFNTFADYVNSELDSSQKPNRDFFDELQVKLQVLESASFFIKKFENAPESRILKF